MSVGIEIAFSLADGRMTKIKSTADTPNGLDVDLLNSLYNDALARTLAVLAIPAPSGEY